MKKTITWLFSAFIAFIFIQSTYFKFSGAAETVIIFNTIGDWMTSIGIVDSLSQIFSAYGAYAVGSAELVASILILLPKTRMAGATLSLGVISGAIFFHLFTPLGINRVIDNAGNTDGGALFYTACVVATSSLLLLVIGRKPSNRSVDFELSQA